MGCSFRKSGYLLLTLKCLEFVRFISLILYQCTLSYRLCLLLFYRTFKFLFLYLVFSCLGFLFLTVILLRLSGCPPLKGMALILAPLLFYLPFSPRLESFAVLSLLSSGCFTVLGVCLRVHFLSCRVSFSFHLLLLPIGLYVVYILS